MPRKHHFIFLDINAIKLVTNYSLWEIIHVTTPCMWKEHAKSTCGFPGMSISVILKFHCVLLLGIRSTYTGVVLLKHSVIDYSLYTRTASTGSGRAISLDFAITRSDNRESHQWPVGEYAFRSRKCHLPAYYSRVAHYHSYTKQFFETKYISSFRQVIEIT